MPPILKIDQNSKRQIQLVQNLCRHTQKEDMYGVNKFAYVSHKLSELNLWNLEGMQTCYILGPFHKINTTKTPLYFYNEISYRNVFHKVSNRYGQVISTPVDNTHLFEISFSINIFCVYILWYQLNKNCILRKKLMWHRV